MKLLQKLKPFDRRTGNLKVVIDTPKRSRNKYAFDFDVGGYRLKSVLPEGTAFSFDFGSIPARSLRMAIRSMLCYLRMSRPLPAASSSVASSA
jgi:hypothetical protein